MRYQVDFLLPLKLQKMSYYFGLCWKILLVNQFAEFFTFGLLDLLILILGVHCYSVLVTNALHKYCLSDSRDVINAVLSANCIHCFGTNVPS